MNFFFDPLAPAEAGQALRALPLGRGRKLEI